MHVPSHTGILPIRVWAVPYAYGQPMRMPAAHMCVWATRTRMDMCVWATRARMGRRCAYGPTLLLRPYVYDCPLCIGMLDHTCIATAMT